MPHFSSATAKTLAAQIAPEEKDFRIFGFDRGAISVILLARELESRKIGVTLAVTLDPLSRRDTEVVPENVSTALCFYQRNGSRTSKLRSNLERPSALTRGDSSTRGIVNEQLHSDADFLIFHEDVPDFVWLQRNLEALLRASRLDLGKVINETMLLQKVASVTTTTNQLV